MTTNPQFRVYIDLGHGEKGKSGFPDPGAVSGVFKEHDMNVVYGTALAERLREHGYNVKTEPGNLSITTSAQTANSFGADLLISCHMNAGGGDRGEVIYSIRKGSKELADAIVVGLKNAGQTVVKTFTKTNDRGSDYYGILRIARMPAVIVEPFFIDNAIDRQIGDTTEKLKKIGVYIADAIASVYGSNLKGSEEVPEWKQKLMDRAHSLGLIDKSLHKPDETASKWFVLAVILNLYDKLKGDK